MMLGRRTLLLAWALASVLPLRALAMRIEPSGIVSDAIGAADWVAEALSASGYRADFTLASFADIDRFFDEQAPGGVGKAGGLLSEDLGARLFAIGSYVGETVRRQLGGEWIGDDDDPQAEINLSLKLADGTALWPVQRVMKRFRNGGTDSIAAYGAALSSARR